MLPDLQLLEQIQQKIQNLSNQRGESKRKIHYGLFLLGFNSGLRISEAIKFDLTKKTKKGLYRIEKSKGKKERFVYIPKAVISELKANNWKPNHTNRFNFYHFLKKIKRDMLMKQLGISQSIELTPHTLRRAFATYHAEAGLPLPLLQKLLGHQSIRTTALYWRNIYGEDGNDTDDILATKNWPKRPKKPKPIPENPVQISLEKLPEPLTPNPLASEPPNYLSKINDLEEKLSQTSQKNNRLKEQNTSLQNSLAELENQNTNLNQAKNQAISENHQLQQNLSQANKIIEKLTQEKVSEQSKRIQAENDLNQEKANSIKQKQTIADLSHQLQTERQTNLNLNIRLTQQEQNQTNLINTYHQTIKNKAEAEKIVQAEKQNTLIQKQRADNYEQQLKSIATMLHQWQKQNHYQQLEQQQSEIKTQIIQPPPWKSK